MSDIAIRVENLGKRYRLGEQVRYRTLRESLENSLRSLWGRRTAANGSSNGHAGGRRRDEEQTLWALKDVSFEVPRGTVLGIIGRNGAGKSTLLKILSRITEPTTGQIEIHGRVGSLLEVGTGFHPELTGRENVYVNGAILGMSRSEIKRKFDEIVDFAGVEKFLDTPVKRYSSGMQVRLAFAVAAHLEPEILVVDEVLAVGDQAFQNKCIRKMEDVSQEGRTVLFVSHNMAAVEALCSEAMLLDAGRLDYRGEIAAVLNRYLTSHSDVVCDVDLETQPRRYRALNPVLSRLIMRDSIGRPTASVQLGSDLAFEIHFGGAVRLEHAMVAVLVFGPRGERLLTCNTHHQCADALTIGPRAVIQCVLHNCRLLPGRYRLGLVVKSRNVTIDQIDTGMDFEVTPVDVYGTGRLPAIKSGFFAPEASWHIVSSEAALRGA